MWSWRLFKPLYPVAAESETQPAEESEQVALDQTNINVNTKLYNIQYSFQVPVTIHTSSDEETTVEVTATLTEEDEALDCGAPEVADTADLPACAMPDEAVAVVEDTAPDQVEETQEVKTTESDAEEETQTITMSTEEFLELLLAMYKADREKTEAKE